MSYEKDKEGNIIPGVSVLTVVVSTAAVEVITVLRDVVIWVVVWPTAIVVLGVSTPQEDKGARKILENYVDKDQT